MNRRTFLTASALSTAGLALSTSTPRLFALAALENKTPLLFGTDYYPDQTPESLWEEDATRMQAFGITNVRIAEFAWALMEPSEGHFDFEWLHRVVKILHVHEIAVILGTPSAAPPPWLTLKYPEIVEVNSSGVALSPSTRRFTCPTNKTYRRLSLAIAAQMADAFASAPGIIGWQIDNEFTLGSSARCYCTYCRTGFQEWLQQKYGTLDALNTAWGTVFWSQHYTAWKEIPVPLPSGAPPNPGHALDYNRYQSYANASFQQEQLTLLRVRCPNHFMTTNNVGAPADNIDLRELYANLDFACLDNYPGFFSVYSPPAGPGSSIPSDQVFPLVSLMNDFMRSVKDGKPHLIMEEQSGKSGQPYFSPQPQPGQLRLWAYQTIAHGAMGINYFRWDTANFGAEEYWFGIINNARAKSPGFDEIQSTIRELKTLGSEALHAPYVAEVALTFDYDCSWALTIQPSHPLLVYATEIATWYSILAATHTGIDFVDLNRDLSRYKVVVAPLQYVLSQKQAANIKTYVESGGIFITSYRLGVKDPTSHIVSTPLPGYLTEVMGVTVRDTVPIYATPQSVKFASTLSGPEAPCNIWADILDPIPSAKVETLATYTADYYSGSAAITSNSYGKGRAIYIAAHLDPASLGRILFTLIATSGIKPRLDLPAGVQMTVRKSASAEWIYLLNTTGEPKSIPLPHPHKDVIAGTSHATEVSLAAWQPRVLQPV